MASLTPQPRNDSAVMASLGSEAPSEAPRPPHLGQFVQRNNARPALRYAEAPPVSTARAPPQEAPLRAGCGTRGATRTGRYRARSPPARSGSYASAMHAQGTPRYADALRDRASTRRSGLPAPLPPGSCIALRSAALLKGTRLRPGRAARGGTAPAPPVSCRRFVFPRPPAPKKEAAPTIPVCHATCARRRRSHVA